MLIVAEVNTRCIAPGCGLLTLARRWSKKVEFSSLPIDDGGPLRVCNNECHTGEYDTYAACQTMRNAICGFVGMAEGEV